MTKLTTLQAELLTQIASEPEGFIEAPAEAHATAKALIKRGLLISMPLADGPSRLLITKEGRKAIGAPSDAEPVASDTGPATPPPTVEPKAPREPKGKIAAVVELLRRPEGASIEAMMAATGWQAHSVRGAMSGSVKKALGLTITSEKTEGGRIYRVVDEANA